MSLRERWMHFFGASPVATRWWAEIETRYSESQRHYHTLAHLDALFAHFDEHRDALRDPQAVAAAIFFHDLIYQPEKSDNEERSALLAAQALAELGFEAARRAAVEHWIRATQKHTPEPGDTDLDYLLDFDLGILAAPAELYRAYAQNIRREFKLYPDLLYQSGRRAVLHGFLEKPAIYRTPVLQKRWENAARANIQREISEL